MRGYQADPVALCSSHLSRRELLRIMACTAATMTLGGCSQRAATGAVVPVTSTARAPSPKPSPLSLAPATPAANTATPEPRTTQPSQQENKSPLSLQARIGQMLLVGFRGLAASDNDLRFLGGVVLFDYDVPSQTPVRNIQSPAQVKALVAALQAAAATPLLVAIDQEGGKVSRLKEKFGFPPTVSAQSLGTTDDLANTRRHALAIAETVAALGINLNLAPVVDLNINPRNPIIGKLERSFSADPMIVTRHALEFIRAHHAHNVRCALKHFPGHGSSTSDSHLGLVDVTRTWSRTELQPFANIIQARQADAIMTAHVFNARIDPHAPATLSRPTITHLLRGELSYDGVVISDDLQMGAITQAYGFEAAIAAAMAAGVDILTLANNTIYEEGVAARAIAVIEGLVRDGTISEERIDESYQRIQRLKRSLRLVPSRSATSPDTPASDSTAIERDKAANPGAL